MKERRKKRGVNERKKEKARSLRKKVREPKAESERVIRKGWVWERIKAKGT